MKKENPQAKSIDQKEIAKFTAMAEEWWSPTGKFKPLHQFNPQRIMYIRQKISKHFNLPFQTQKPLEGLKVLDIGCGGGLLSEPIKRLGATVTAIDASEKNIEIAKIHAKQENLDIDYRAISAEEIAKSSAQYDIILNMEVLEHVACRQSFLESCYTLLQPKGIMFFATLNRTPQSFALAIIGAEYILKWLPVGTHNWHKFITPKELQKDLENIGFEKQDLIGVVYKILSGVWEASPNISVNYMGFCTKK